MPRIRFIWDDWNVDHIAQHGVDPEEIEEVFTHFHIIRRTRQRRRLAYGQTLDGRYLLIVFIYRDFDTIYVITARDMTIKEKRFYKRRAR